MSKANAENARLKREYLIWMKQAHGRSDATVDAAAQALARFEEYTRHRSFKKFNRNQAIGFKGHLQNEVNARTGQTLSLATVSAILSQVRDFFRWLADRPGFRRVVSYSDLAYFGLTDREERIADTATSRPRPTMEQLLHILKAMPSVTIVERRDRAVVAFAMLTGARDGSFPGVLLRHVDLDQRAVHFDPRDVHTKFAKDIRTWFFPVDQLAEQILREWIEELPQALLFGPDDPLFPQTKVGLDEEQRFGVQGLARTPWSTASAVRQIFKAACGRVGLPYFNPHGVRHALGVLGTKICRTPEEMKAWSQNLGHDHVLTTFTSYGKVEPSRQAEIIRKMSEQSSDVNEDTLSAAELKRLRKLLRVKPENDHD